VKVLLDTHIWIWSVLEPHRLVPRVVRKLASAEVHLSPISLWEALLLIEKKRIVVKGSADDWMARALAAGPFREAPLTFEVAAESRRLRIDHQDPADRFIAATAKVYDLTLVTADEHLLGASGFRHLANR
jgi:PIN domain nuclease of toxin-antitoxin system